MAEGDLKTLTIDEIEQHNSAASTWIIINDKVCIYFLFVIPLCFKIITKTIAHIYS